MFLYEINSKKARQVRAFFTIVVKVYLEDKAAGAASPNDDEKDE